MSTAQMLQQQGMTLLTTVAQALPTNVMEPLAAAGVVPVPTTPASPLSVQAAQPLAVAGPNGLQVPSPATMAVRPVVPSWTYWALGGLLAVGALYYLRKPRRK